MYLYEMDFVAVSIETCENFILARGSRRIPPSLDFEKTMEACEIYDHTSIHFFKEKSKEEKYFYLSSLKVSKIAPGGNASRAKKKRKKH